MGIAGAELHVMAHHQHRHAAGEQRAHHGGEGLLELGVQPLGWLVHQQDIRLQQHDLGQRRTLLFTAGEVVGMVVQQFRQTAKGHHLLHPTPLLRRGQMQPVEGLKQILPDGLFHEQRLRVLGQDPQPTRMAHRATVGPQSLAEEPQSGGFAGAVAAQQGHELPPPNSHMETSDNIRALFLVFEPHVLRRQHHLAAGRDLLRRQGPGGVIREPLRQEGSALPHRHRAGGIALYRGPDPHGGGHGQKHPVSLLPQQAAHLRRCAGTQQPSAVHHRRMGCQRQSLLQPMLRQKDGGPQLPIDAPQRLKEVRGGNGV